MDGYWLRRSVGDTSALLTGSPGVVLSNTSLSILAKRSTPATFNSVLECFGLGTVGGGGGCTGCFCAFCLCVVFN